MTKLVTAELKELRRPPAPLIPLPRYPYSKPVVFNDLPADLHIASGYQRGSLGRTSFASLTISTSMLLSFVRDHDQYIEGLPPASRVTCHLTFESLHLTVHGHARTGIVLEMIFCPWTILFNRGAMSTEQLIGHFARFMT